MIDTVLTENSDSTKITRMHFIMPFVLQSIAWPLGRLALHFFVRLKVEGKENLEAAAKKNNVGIIFAVTHTHELDAVMVLSGVLPFSKLFPMFYVTRNRKKYTTTQGFGWRSYLYSFPTFFSSWGAHQYIAGQRDYTKSMPYHELLLQHGKSVCIFPEGKIVDSQGVRKMHGGVSYLSEKTNAFIVSVHISGVSNMNMSEFMTRKRRATIIYGAPVQAKNIINQSDPVPDRYQNAARLLMFGKSN